MTTNPFARPAQPPAQQAPPQQAPQQAAATGGWATQPPQQGPPADRQPLPPASAFGQPNKGGGQAITGDQWKTFIGYLVLFEVREFRRAVPTKNGEADAVVADIHVIDHPEEPKVFEGTLVFPPALVSATKEVRDEKGHLVHEAGRGAPYMVLGRIAEYTTKAQRVTVELADHTEADVKTATDYLAWRQAQRVAQPARTNNADPWATPAAAPEEPPF